ncbi:MAG: nitroreductase, partial [Gammaproteobacteria bacterium]
AIGAVTFAAATLGWKTRLIHSVTDNELATLLGLRQQTGIEAEHPDCLLAIFPFDVDETRIDPIVNLPTALLERLKTIEFDGCPNQLSNKHHDWPTIERVAEACRLDSNCPLDHKRYPLIKPDNKIEFDQDRQLSARKIIRERRSALAMDGRSTISRNTFYRMMMRVSPQMGKNIIEVLPWRACVSLAIFIHRVDDLPSGLYMLVRDPAHEPSLKKAFRSEFHWNKPEGCPETLPLYLLQVADAYEVAQTISCHQDIAADGAFAHIVTQK